MATRRPKAAGRPLRVYVDTSVFGGVHDEEFREPSERFFTAVRAGAFVVLVSEAPVVEISSAPAVVQATFEAHRRPRPRRPRLPKPTWPPASFPQRPAWTRSTWPRPPSREPTPS
ncbi:MAG TPA: hypothetical protein VKM54_28505 [Myxococcota bacterium]|nr:hypothetical protein [Myxococcota bacterium]